MNKKTRQLTPAEYAYLKQYGWGGAATGAAQGAALGATVGSLGGPVGTAIGAVGVGIGMGVKGWFDEEEQNKQLAEKENQAKAHVANQNFWNDETNKAFGNWNARSSAVNTPFLEAGGQMNQNMNGIIQSYNGQSHQGAQGGIPVDQLGRPSSVSNQGPIALVEDGEVSWNGYVFSKKLKGKSKKSFADEAKKILSKYKKRLGDNFEHDDKMATDSMNLELGQLSKENEAVKEAKGLNNEPQQSFAFGGNFLSKSMTSAKSGTFMDKSSSPEPSGGNGAGLSAGLGIAGMLGQMGEQYMDSEYQARDAKIQALLKANQPNPTELGIMADGGELDSLLNKQREVDTTRMSNDKFMKITKGTHNYKEFNTKLDSTMDAQLQQAFNNAGNTGNHSVYYKGNAPINPMDTLSNEQLQQYVNQGNHVADSIQQSRSFANGGKLGQHTMPDGTVHPYSSHALYMASMNKKAHGGKLPQYGYGMYLPDGQDQLYKDSDAKIKEKPFEWIDWSQPTAPGAYQDLGISNSRLGFSNDEMDIITRQNHNTQPYPSRLSDDEIDIIGRQNSPITSEELIANAQKRGGAGMTPIEPIQTTDLGIKDASSIKDVSNFSSFTPGSITRKPFEYKNSMLGYLPGAVNTVRGLFDKAEKQNLYLQDRVSPRRYRADEAMRQAQTANYNRLRAYNPSSSHANAAQRIASNVATQDQISRIAEGEFNMNERMAQQADMTNVGIDARNIQTRLGVDDINARNRAAKDNLITTGMSQMSQEAIGQRRERNTQEMLYNMYPSYDKIPNKTEYFSNTVDTEPAHKPLVDGNIDRTTVQETPMAGIELESPQAPITVKETKDASSVSPTGKVDTPNNDLVSKIAQVESNNVSNAKNPDSSATGIGQFVNRTWLEMMDKYLPGKTEGKTQKEILALRNDPEISKRMISNYATENKNYLEEKGYEGSDSNIYLAHHFGGAGAVKLLKSDKSAMVKDVISDSAYKSNPYLHDKTVKFVLDRIERKMK